jgi:hypothetical protein
MPCLILLLCISASGPSFINNIHSHTNPGEYLEIQDICTPPRSDDSTDARTDLETWGHLMLEASIKLGLPLNSAETVKQNMIEAGYVDVVEVVYKWPMNGWPADKTMKEIGT